MIWNVVSHTLTGKQPEMLALLPVNNHNLAGASNQSVFTWQVTPLLVTLIQTRC